MLWRQVDGRHACGLRSKECLVVLHPVERAVKGIAIVVSLFIPMGQTKTRTTVLDGGAKILDIFVYGVCGLYIFTSNG